MWKVCIRSLMLIFSDIHILNTFWKLQKRFIFFIDKIWIFQTVWILIQSGHHYSPRLDISPILTMCGQCWSVLAKNGFVTPRMTPGLKYMILLLDHTVLAISLALCLNTMPGLTGQVLVAFEVIIFGCKAVLFSVNGYIKTEHHFYG